MFQESIDQMQEVCHTFLENQKKKEAYKEAMKSYVPPAHAKVEEEDEDEGENKEEEEEEGHEPSQPSKKAKKAGAPLAKKAKTTAKVLLSADILAEAKEKGLDTKLKKMMAVPKVLDNNIEASVVLKALEKAGGKAIAAVATAARRGIVSVSCRLHIIIIVENHRHTLSVEILAQGF